MSGFALKLGSGFKALAASIGISTTALGAFLGVAAGIAAIAGVIAIINKFTVSFEEASKAADDAAAAYDDAKADVEATNGELETTQQRIAELEAKGALTLVEKDELENLRLQNDELQRRLELEEQIEHMRGMAAAQAASDELNNRDYSVTVDAPTYDSFSGAQISDTSTVQTTLLQGAIIQQERLNQKTEQQKQLEQDLLDLKAKGLKEGDREYDNTNKQLKAVNKEVQSLNELQASALAELSEQRLRIDGYDQFQDQADAIDAFFEEIAPKSEKVADAQAKIDKLLSRPTLSEQVAEAEKFAQAMNGITLDQLERRFPEIANSARAAGLDIEDVIDTINSKAGTVNVDAYRKQLVSNMMGESDGTTAWLHQYEQMQADIDSLSDEEIEILYSILPDDLSGYSFEDLKAAIRQAQEAAAEADLSLDSHAESVSKFTTELSSLQSAISSQSATGTLSFDVFNADDMADYASALEAVNGGYQYNIEAVNEIVKAKAEELKQENDLKKTNAQLDYLQRAKEIQKLRDQYDDLGDSEEDIVQKEELMAEIRSLKDENAGVYRDIQGFNVLSASIDQATSSYQTWLNAQNATNSGQMFSDVGTAFSRINDVLRNEDSDLYRQIGNKQYQADLEFILPDKSMTESQITEWWDDFSRFFVFTEDGAIDDLNIPQFAQEAVDAGLMNYSEQDGWTVAAGKSLDDFAKHFNTTKDVMASFFDYWNLYLDEAHQFTWTDEMGRSFADLMVDAHNAADTIRSEFETMPDGETIKINLDVDDFEDKEQAIEVLQQNIDQMNELKATMNLDDSQLKAANDVIEASVAKMQVLSAPVVMQVNTANFTGPLSNAISILQEWQNAQWNYQSLVAIGADSSQIQAAQEELDTLTQKVQSLDMESIGLDVDVTDAESIQESLDSMDYEALVKLVPDDALMDTEEYAKEVQATVNLDDSQVQAFLEQDLDRSAVVVYSPSAGAVSRYSPPTKYGEVIYTVKTVGSVSTSSSSSSSSGRTTPSRWTVSSGGTRVMGTANAGGKWGDNRGGRTLVGELGREIVVDPRTGTWYTVGDNGAEFVNIPKGSIVFNHEQTEDLLRDGNTLGRAIAFSNARALASGNAFLTGGTGGSFDMDLFKKRISGGYTSAGNSLNSSSSSNRVTGNQKASGDEDNWFERMYAYHNHLINMEQEEVADYLKWLNDAYKQAYEEQIIELEDYYQYQEEVFEKLRELYQDSLDDVEHTISMLEHYQGTGPQIVAYYKSLMASIEKEIWAARAAGLNDNDEYIQELQDRWWSYSDAIVDIEQTTLDEAEDTLDELVRFRMDMIKQELENEQDSYNERLDNLKDFYDKQKQLLQDQEDEEDYLREQAKKRKAVSDLEQQLTQLELDDSAWASKRKLELREDLAEAREALEEFEREHARKQMEEQLDDQYQQQADAINDELSLLQEKLSSERELYDQALEDIRNDNGTLMQEMIEWNAQYGSFIDRDITQMWNAASEALKNYQALYNDWYLGVQMKPQSATSTTPPSVAPSTGSSWSDNPISEDYYNEKNPTPPPSQSGAYGPGSDTGGSSSAQQDDGSANRPYGYVEDYSGNIQYGHTGNKVKAVQNALNKLGYGNSGTTGLDGIFGVNTRQAVYNFQKANGLVVDGIVGVKTKAAFKKKGYASGTSGAFPGLHQIDELGPEYLFTSSDGNKYRVFSGGEKVLNARATDFLYQFANSGGQVIKDMIAAAMGSDMVSRMSSAFTPGNISMGDIIIQGNASEKTVSEIRRVQRENVDYMLKQFKKLNA